MRRVVIVAFDGIHSLDVSGPLEVLWAARYSVTVAGPTNEPVRAASGLRLVVDSSLDDVDGPLDTLIVAGSCDAAPGDPRVVAAVRRLAPQSRRVASVCAGAFLLAEAGLLDGRRAVTHWRWCDELTSRFPSVHVERNPIFIRDGNILTSAGITAGMDLALAMVEEDEGAERALFVAKALVMYVQRPGGQAQFSAVMRANRATTPPIRAVQDWLADHLADDLSVDALAAQAAMSPRHFARVFRAETGVSPGRYVEDLRIEAAQQLLASTQQSVDDIASACGFASADTMRRAFLRVLCVPPAEYRRHFKRRPE